MRINKHDTSGTKPLLGKGELGYDDYVAGGDAGRVYVGTGSENIALAEKYEIDSHAGRTDNPHSVTKAQVGLANVDNTSDANKPISTATQNALNAKVDTSTNQTIGGVKTFSSSPIVPTPTTGTQAANKDYVDTKVDKVTSTDNAIARYDGTTGKLQNSSVVVDDNGNLLLASGTGALGYGAGAGGTVTQLTSKSTSVTLNKPSGAIITNNEALAGGASVIFYVNNSLVTNGDLLYCFIDDSRVGNIYSVLPWYVNNGIFYLQVKNNDLTSYSDTFAIKFVIIKGATA